MTLAQLMLFTFISMWVLGDVAGSEYHEKLYFSLMMAIGVGYLNNVHGILWLKMKRILKMK